MEEDSSVPVIDLSELSPQARVSAGEVSSDERSTAEALVEALSRVGFVALSGHGIGDEHLSALQRASRAFFALPSAQKARIAMKYRGRAWRGYFTEGAELTSGRPDQKEGIYFGVHHPPEHPLVRSRTPMHGENLWPDQPAPLRTLVEAHMREAQSLGELLLRLIAVGLGLEPDYFALRFRGASPTCLFRIFNYPAHPRDSQYQTWGVGPHTDMGLLTLLFQDASGGLELQRRDGSWIEAPADPARCLVNIGDMLERWTWGHLRATLHRVQSPQRGPRLSFPFFYDPPWAATLEAIDPARLSSLHHARRFQERKRRGENEGRWDGLKLHEIDPKLTYGEFVWSKIRDVFPTLAERAADGRPISHNMHSEDPQL